MPLFRVLSCMLLTTTLTFDGPVKVALVAIHTHNNLDGMG